MPSGIVSGESVSVIVPMLDEQGNVDLLLDELQAAMAGRFSRYEIVVVDDGSSDATFKHLKAAIDNRADLPLRVLRHRRTFGQTAALATGFEASCGRIVVTLDGDLQNDPSDIPALIARLDQGADVVCGWRRQRQEGPVRDIPSRLAAVAVGRLTGLRIHDVGCTLRAYRREIIDDLDLWGDMHRFIPALCHAVGARVEELEVRHRPRHAGRTKYGRTGLGRLFRVALDLHTLRVLSRYRGQPIRAVGWWAFGALAAAAATALVASAGDLRLGLIVGLCLCLVYAAVLLMAIGTGAELSARAYAAAAGARPGYVKEDLRSAAWEELWQSPDTASEGGLANLVGSSTIC